MTSLEAKRFAISLNMEVLERIRKENEQNTVWGDSFTDEPKPEPQHNED